MGRTATPPRRRCSFPGFYPPQSSRAVCGLQATPGPAPESESLCPNESFGLERQPTARRSAFCSRAHWGTSTLRSRREVCNRSRVPRDAPSPGSPPVAAIRMARRNTSDFDTFQRCANASSTLTDSTSSEYVDLIVIMAIATAASISRAAKAPWKSQSNRGVFQVSQLPIQDATPSEGGGDVPRFHPTV